MKRICNRLLLLAFGLALAVSSVAQVTTASISGRVTDGKDPLIGATVLVVSIQSGTKYGTVTNTDGYYTIQNIRTGSAYRVDVAYIGYTTQRYDNVIFHLGETYPLNVVLKESSQNLQDVVVTASKVVERAGTNTDISARQIESMPSVSRSITDFTRLSPYSGSSSSFAGQDGRYNNITIDGAAFNNNFGLSSNNLPGGDSQPISLDAIQEISVNVAPYDIRQSSFTGASVNAVTRSGDNTFQGSAYTYIHPDKFTGGNVGGVSIANAQTTSKQTYGFRLGGPIIKDKLFFFVNGEFENKTYPSGAFSPSTTGTGSVSNNTARTSADSLQLIKNYLISKYGYNPGNYENFSNFTSQNFKMLGRVDWNINDKNKLTVRYNYVHSENDVLTNATSGPSGITKPSGRSNINSVAFSNSFYKMLDIVGSITGELNTTFNPQFSNKFLANYTHIQDKRTSPSSLFPFVDIWDDINNVNDNYMSFGYELFSYNNNVVNNTVNLSNNLSYNIGKHTFTGGVSYDNYYFLNSYMREGTSYYRYSSVNAFINGAQPTAFGYTYGYNGNSAPGAQLSFGMGAVYLQDEWKIEPNLKLNYGVRVEQPFYWNSLTDNPNIDALTFLNGYKMNSGTWPSPKPTLAPRVGFNWDINGDRSVVLRGGSGIFTGLLPFVWFTNQPTASGMLQSPEIALTGSQLPAHFKFEPNFQNLQNDYPSLFTSTPGVLPTGASLCEVGKNFKMPQVWRSSLATDIKLPASTQLTIETLYTKDINAVVQENVNLPEAQSSFAGPDQRQRWTSNKINSSIGSAMVLENTNKGYSYSFSAQLKKNFDFGLSAMIAYTYTMAKDESPNPGSTAASAWSSNVAVNNLNNPGLSYSGFAVPHRLVGSLSYKLTESRNFATTISIFYNGAPQGRNSYTFSNDMNGDNNSSDLLYIPTLSQLQSGAFTFVDAKDKSGNVLMTAAAQRDAFWNYIQSDSYLRAHEGKYVDRFGEIMPWVHDFDLKLLQDIATNFGTKHKYTLQLSFDILNIGNLLNSNWGTQKTMGVLSYNNIALLTYKGVVSASNPTPTYTLNATSITNFINNTQWVNYPSTTSTWNAMVGLRLIF
jgi:hypothetical protein